MARAELPTLPHPAYNKKGKSNICWASLLGKYSWHGCKFVHVKDKHITDSFTAESCELLKDGVERCTECEPFTKRSSGTPK